MANILVGLCLLVMVNAIHTSGHKKAIPARELLAINEQSVNYDQAGVNAKIGVDLKDEIKLRVNLES